jgi:uncharacterized membrane protein
MYKSFMKKKETTRAYIGIVFCAIVFVIGYFILNYISTKEEPPLGATFNILIGSILIATSAVGIIIILKYLYDLKEKLKRRERKRKKHKIVFLKDSKKQTKNE